MTSSISDIALALMFVFEVAYFAAITVNVCQRAPKAWAAFQDDLVRVGRRL